MPVVSPNVPRPVEVSAVDTVESEARELLRRRGLDPFNDRLAMRHLDDETVEEIWIK